MLTGGLTTLGTVSTEEPGLLESLKSICPVDYNKTIQV